MPAQASIRMPGVYLEQVTPSPEPALDTGVPVFLGLFAAAEGALSPGAAGVSAIDAAAWSKLEARWGAAWIGGSVGFAVRGFFENGGRRCHVVAPAGGRAGDSDAVALDRLEAGLAAIEAIDDLDLVCAPDLAARGDDARIQGQTRILEHCAAHAGRFAILDGAGSAAPSGTAAEALAAHADALARRLGAAAEAANGALYGPWIEVRGACPACGGAGGACKTCWGTGAGFVPPCGHVAGVYARIDGRTGVHQAPANAVLSGVTDLQVAIDDAAQAQHRARRLNVIRALPGRGVRIWDARTLSADPAWTYVNVRRLILTVSRWLERTMAGVAFEPNDLKLWIRIQREVGSYLDGLFRRGALEGRTAAEAYYVKCDDETNPAEVRDAGQVVAEVGLAAASPNEFIVVRLSGGAGQRAAGEAETET